MDSAAALSPGMRLEKAGCEQAREAGSRAAASMGGGRCRHRKSAALAGQASVALSVAARFLTLAPAASTLWAARADRPFPNAPPARSATSPWRTPCYPAATFNPLRRR
jgi:hypothetical protein